VPEQLEELVEFFLDTEAPEMEFEVARCRPRLTPDFFAHLDKRIGGWWGGGVVPGWRQSLHVGVGGAGILEPDRTVGCAGGEAPKRKGPMLNFACTWSGARTPLRACMPPLALPR
jgi:hypothetical protein